MLTLLRLSQNPLRLFCPQLHKFQLDLPEPLLQHMLQVGLLQQRC